MAVVVAAGDRRRAPPRSIHRSRAYSHWGTGLMFAALQRASLSHPSHESGHSAQVPQSITSSFVDRVANFLAREIGHRPAGMHSCDRGQPVLGAGLCPGRFLLVMQRDLGRNRNSHRLAKTGWIHVVRAPYHSRRADYGESRYCHCGHHGRRGGARLRMVPCASGKNTSALSRAAPPSITVVSLGQRHAAAWSDETKL